MENTKEKAWKHLTKKEQTALSLIVVSERTRKEASIIMNLSPYKFNEIYLRSRKFFLMFSEYYEVYGELFPTIPIRDDFKLYVNSLLTLRKRPSIVNTEPLFINIQTARERRKLWDTILITQPEFKDGHTGGFLNLIYEFDRWNNFRVLPKDCQRPAAFPRRRNRELKKIQQNLYAISALGWNLLEQEYEVTSPPFTYVPMITVDNFGILQVKQSKVNLTYFSDNKIPLFRTALEATKFAELLYDYRNFTRKSSHSARKFWASFRLLFNKAENYAELLNIKEEDETAITNKDRKFLESVGKKKIKAPKPTSGEQFWI